MYGNAVGFNPQRSLLGGLSTNGNVGAFAKGQAYQNASGLNMDAAQKNQEFGKKQMQQQSDLRQKQNAIQAETAGHHTQEQLADEGLQNRRTVFDIGMNYDYAQMFKQRQTQLLNTLISHAAREF